MRAIIFLPSDHHPNTEGNVETMRLAFDDPTTAFWNASTRAATAFERGDFSRALTDYDTAFSLAPKLPVPERVAADLARLHLNLNAAKAALRLGKLSAAAERAEGAIEWHAVAQPGLTAAAPYAAALAVRAECRAKLFDYAGAASDYEVLSRRADGDFAERRAWHTRAADAARLRGASHYAVLGASHNAPAASVVQLYRRASRRWHPDKHARDDDNGARSKVHFLRINEAKQVLGETYGRVVYDASNRSVIAAEPELTGFVTGELFAPATAVGRYPWLAEPPTATAAEQQQQQSEEEEQQRLFAVLGSDCHTFDVGPPMFLWMHRNATKSLGGPRRAEVRR